MSDEKDGPDGEIPVNRRAAGARERPLAVAKVALALMLLPLIGCAGPSDPEQSPPPFNILIVVLDSLRVDKLGVYGFERPTSPRIDELAADPDAVVYAGHHVHSGFTKISTASLFTGLMPFQHGVDAGRRTPASDQNDGAAQIDGDSAQILDGSHVTMAERLGQLGYRCFGIVMGNHISSPFGFGQGFDPYLAGGEAGLDPERVARTLELASAAPGPFFGYLHLQAVHQPRPSEKRDPEYMTTFGFAYDEEARMSVDIDFTRPKIKFQIGRGEVDLTEDDVRFLHLVYEAVVKKVDDRLVGRLIDGLRARSLYDSTMIVLTADHGDELFDHRGYGHAAYLWETVLNVPLVVKFPRGRRPAELPDRVDHLTSAIDVLPSLLSFLGSPASDLPGVPSLLGSPSRFSYANTPAGAWSLIHRRLKLIEDPGAIGTHLYDLREDPGETRNLAHIDVQAVARLRHSAEVLRRTAKGARTEAAWTEPEPRHVDELRALGYIE